MANIDRLAAVYEDALVTRLGVSMRRANPRTILIEQEPLTFGLGLDAADPEYLYMFCPISAPSQVDLEMLRGICLRTTREKKVVKVTLDDDGDLRFTVEMLIAGHDRLPDAEHLAQILRRAIHMIGAAVSSVLTAIRFESVIAET